MRKTFIGKKVYFDSKKKEAETRTSEIEIIP